MTSLALFVTSPLARHLLEEQPFTAGALFCASPQSVLDTLDTHVGLIEYQDRISLHKKNREEVLDKPISLTTLLQKLARLEIIAQKHYTIGKYTLDLTERSLIGQHEIIALREKEAALLAFLLERPNQALSKATLLKAIWDYSAEVETRTLETHIYQLRQKIEATPEAPKIILNTPTGYTLIKDEH